MAGPNRNIQQLRLVDGTEIVANILHWEENDYIEANNILIMEPLDSPEDDDRAYYILKPLVSYTDDMAKTSTLNPNTVISVTEPSPTVLQQYGNSLRDIIRQMGTEIDDGPTNVVSFDSRKKLLTEEDESL
jgi:hypothetical protein